MYKLREQPISRIFDEMVNYSPLCHRVAICKVKEPFSIYDITYEEGDLVALSGDSESKIGIEYYQDFKKTYSYNLHYGVSGDTLSIPVNDFKKRFELCEKETIKVEDMIKQAKDIEYEKYCEIEEKRADPYEDYIPATLGMMGIIATILAFVFLVFRTGAKESILTSLIFLAIILGFFFFNFVKDIKYRIIDKKYSNKYLEMDKQREQNGMYIPEEI